MNDFLLLWYERFLLISSTMTQGIAAFEVAEAVCVSMPTSPTVVMAHYHEHLAAGRRALSREEYERLVRTSLERYLDLRIIMDHFESFLA